LNKYKLLLSQPVGSSQSLTTFACANSFLSTLVLLADSARGLHWLDLASGQLVRTVADAHSKPIHCISLNAPSAFVADEGEQSIESHQLFATVAADSAIKLWDVRSPECARRLSGHVNRAAPVRASFSPCGRFLASGSEDNRAYVFDLRTGNILDKLAGATDLVCDVAYNPLHPQLVTAGYDGRIRFYTT
jgi:WD40 repeat protein